MFHSDRSRILHYFNNNSSLSSIPRWHLCSIPTGVESSITSIIIVVSLQYLDDISCIFWTTNILLFYLSMKAPRNTLLKAPLNVSPFAKPSLTLLLVDIPSPRHWDQSILLPVCSLLLLAAWRSLLSASSYRSMHSPWNGDLGGHWDCFAKNWKTSAVSIRPMIICKRRSLHTPFLAINRDVPYVPPTINACS